MICLTGDVHHDALQTNEQRFLLQQGRRVSEVDVAVDYVRLCEKHGVKCTLYATGLTLAGQWGAFRPAAESHAVEIGGHTYGGLPRSILDVLWARLRGRAAVSHAHSHGSYDQQLRDAQRMVDIGRQRLGKDIVSWRSHGLVRDGNTNRILYQVGIRFLSDEVSWTKHQPERLVDGLISHPLNVIMDHDHIYHAHRDQAYVDKLRQDWPFKDDPTSESYTIEAWGRMVEQQVQAIEAAGGLATVLMHPLCMYVADGFRTMERLLGIWSQSRTVWASEVGECMAEKKPGESPRTGST